MINPNMLLAEAVKIVVGCPPAALTTTAGDGDYVSLKNYQKLTIVLAVKNGTTVTGGAITLLQATAVAGTGEKALAFSTVYANVDVAASDALVETAVTNNTFTTNTTNSKDLLYVINVDASSLDVDNGFDCVRIDSASMANAVGSVIYLLSGARYGSSVATLPSAIIN